MRYFLLALGILLAVVGGLLVLIVLLLLPRTGVWVRAQNTDQPKSDRVELAIKYGFLRKIVLQFPKKPKKPKKDKPEKSKKPKKPKKEKPEKSPDQPKPDRVAQLGAVVQLLHDLHHSLTLNQIAVDMTVASGDPATTGQLYGMANALAGSLTAFLHQWFSISRYHVDIGVDFTQKATTYDPDPHTRYHVVFVGSIRPLFLIATLVWHWKKYWVLIPKKTKTPPAEK